MANTKWGKNGRFSWRKKNSWPIKASRIDFALVSGGLDQKVKITQYVTSVFTDHRAFYMCVVTEPFQRGIGYWKFNSSLLRNKNFIKVMNDEITQPYCHVLKRLQIKMGKSQG